MGMGETKEVFFDEYCKICNHYLKSESEEPCFSCLEDPVRAYSHKPEKFEWNGQGTIPKKKERKKS